MHHPVCHSCSCNLFNPSQPFYSNLCHWPGFQVIAKTWQLQDALSLFIHLSPEHHFNQTFATWNVFSQSCFSSTLWLPTLQHGGARGHGISRSRQLSQTVQCTCQGKSPSRLAASEGAIQDLRWVWKARFENNSMKDIIPVVPHEAVTEVSRIGNV